MNIPSFSKRVCLAAVLLVGLLVVACGGEAKPAETTGAAATKPTIILADNTFETGWINNAIFEFIVKNGYGYPVEQVPVSTVVLQASIAKGDLDVVMEMWVQNFLDWWKKETGNGNVIDMGSIYSGGDQFFTIPKWVAEQYGIKTVFDMKDPKIAQLFQDPEDSSKGSFINCIIGWQCAEINRAKLKAYGLDQYYNIISPGASSAMDAALAGAQKKNKPVFGYYWSPTSMMGAYQWHILEEPPYTDTCWDEVVKGQFDTAYTPKEACAYRTELVVKAVHKSFPQKAPDVVEMLRKMDVGLQSLNETAAWGLANDIQGDWEKAAVYYLRTYEDRWKAWVPEDAYRKTREALAKES